MSDDREAPERIWVHVPYRVRTKQPPAGMDHYHEYWLTGEDPRIDELEADLQSALDMKDHYRAALSDMEAERDALQVWVVELERFADKLLSRIKDLKEKLKEERAKTAAFKVGRKGARERADKAEAEVEKQKLRYHKARNTWRHTLEECRDARDKAEAEVQDLERRLATYHQIEEDRFR